MIRFNHILTYTLLLFIAGMFSATAMGADGKVHYQINKWVHEGDSAYLSMIINAEDAGIKSRQSARIIPTVTDGTNELLLPEVELKGANNYKAYRRRLALMNREQKQAYSKTAPYIVARSYDGESRKITYSASYKYEQWMDNARLEARNSECGCSGKVNGVENEILMQSMEHPQTKFIPALALVSPEAEDVKLRNERMECFLDFAVNKTDIRPDYMNNPRELAKVRGMIEKLKTDDAVTVEEMDVIGYASPEGSAERNQWLSEQRAGALCDYLSYRYDFPKNIYKIRFGGENWDGLRKAMENSYAPYKDAVISILDNSISNEDKKKGIARLQGGTPYKEMLKEIYPTLRVAVCQVNYKVRAFSLEEAQKVMKVNPKNLSLNEMYLVANSYETGSQEYNDAFDTAVHLYPNDATANINAAANALARNDIATAERYLDNVKTRVRIPEYDNCRGVLEMLKGNKNAAKNYFEQAAKAGLKEAQINLKQIQ